MQLLHPLQSLGLTLPTLGVYPFPLHPRVTTQDANSGFVHVCACVGVSVSDGRTDPDPLMPLPSREILPACLAQHSLAIHVSYAQTRGASEGEADNKATVGELQQ